MGSSDRLERSVEKLLKVARLKADDVNAELAAIRVSRNSTETALAQLDHADLQERHRIERMQARDPGLSIEPAINAFTERSRIKRANMAATLAQLNTREAHTKTALQEAFSEIKKLEHLIEIAERKRATDMKRRQNTDRNEMIGVRYGSS